MEKIENRVLEEPFARIDFVGGEEIGYWLVTTRYGDEVPGSARKVCERECELFTAGINDKERCGGITVYEDGKRGGAVVVGAQSTVFGDAKKLSMAGCIRHINKTL